MSKLELTAAPQETKNRIAAALSPPVVASLPETDATKAGEQFWFGGDLYTYAKEGQFADVAAGTVVKVSFDPSVLGELASKDNITIPEVTGLEAEFDSLDYGDNYAIVRGLGTPSENRTELITKYNYLKSLEPNEDKEANLILSSGYYLSDTEEVNVIEFISTSGFSPSGAVRSIAIQSDGKILVGGGFTSYNGTTENIITRLNADGSRDESFDIGTGFIGAVESLAIQSDGKILVGGSFTSYNGATRLNPDGSIDETFDIGTGFNNRVVSIAIQDDGKILVGGWYTSYNGTAQNGITRLNVDGSRDESFDIGTGFNDRVDSIAIQDDGKILVGGRYASYNGTTQNGITRLNPDGSIDESFNADIEDGYYSSGWTGVEIFALALKNDIIYVGGLLDIGGAEGMGVLNSDGSIATQTSITEIVPLTLDHPYINLISLANGTPKFVSNDIEFPALTVGTDNIKVKGVDTYPYKFSVEKMEALTPLDFGTGFGFNGGLYEVFSIAIQSDGKILVGGIFIDYNGTTQNYITRLNSDGSRDETFDIGTGFNSAVFSLAIQSDGKILVGGAFISYNGTTQNRITRLNTDGSRDESFNIGDGFNNSVRSIAIQSDGKILVGGDFISYNGTTQNRITRLNTDGSRDEKSFNIGDGFNNSVRSLAIQSDGKILVGGNFISYNGTTQNRITRLNTDGSIDTSFDIGTGFSNAVYSLAIQSDGKILVGGNLISYNGTTQNRITRLNVDGSRDETFDVGTGFNDIVLSIVTHPDGKILVGGDFISYNGTTQNRITRLNPDGSLDIEYTPLIAEGTYSINYSQTVIFALTVEGDVTYVGGILNIDGAEGIGALNLDGSVYEGSTTSPENILLEDIASGDNSFENCYGILRRCIAGENSFKNIQGKLINCELTKGTFETPQPSGKILASLETEDGNFMGTFETPQPSGERF